MPKLSTATQALRRERILDAAEQCFARTGFHRTTMQDICRAAGISPGALYLYFGSKEALIEGIVDRDRDSVLSHLSEAATAPDLLDGLRKVMECCVLGQPAHKPALFLEIGAEATRNPRISAILTACDATLRDTLRRLLDGAQRSGTLSRDLDSGRIALVMAMLADAMFFRRAIAPDFDPEAVAPILFSMVALLLGQETDQDEPGAAAPRSVPTLAGVFP